MNNEDEKIDAFLDGMALLKNTSARRAGHEISHHQGTPRESEPNVKRCEQWSTNRVY